MKEERQIIRSPYMPDSKKNSESASMEASNDLIICPHCNRGVSHPHVIYAKGKGSGSPLFWCKSCRKKFGVSHKSINWPFHFGRLYSVNFTESHEKSAIRARYQDFMSPAAQRLFDSRLRHYRQQLTSVEYTIEYAFVGTIKELQLKADERNRKNDRDNWDVVINLYNSELSYELDFILFKAENAGMVFSKKQDQTNPLVHCHRCGGSNIIRYGFSPVGRRRFYCKDCGISFVLRAEHLFSFSYVKSRLIEIITRFNPENITKFHLPMLEEVCFKLATDFMEKKNLKRITRELQHQFLVHEVYRVREIEAFAKKIPIKKTIITMETLPVEEQDRQAAKVLMLGKSKAVKENYASELYGKNFLIDDRMNDFIDVEIEEASSLEHGIDRSG